MALICSEIRQVLQMYERRTELPFKPRERTPLLIGNPETGQVITAEELARTSKRQSHSGLRLNTQHSLTIGKPLERQVSVVEPTRQEPAPKLIGGHAAPHDNAAATRLAIAEHAHDLDPQSLKSDSAPTVIEAKIPEPNHAHENISTEPIDNLGENSADGAKASAFENTLPATIANEVSTNAAAIESIGVPTPEVASSDSGKEKALMKTRHQYTRDFLISLASRNVIPPPELKAATSIVHAAPGRHSAHNNVNKANNAYGSGFNASKSADAMSFAFMNMNIKATPGERGASYVKKSYQGSRAEGAGSSEAANSELAGAASSTASSSVKFLPDFLSTGRKGNAHGYGPEHARGEKSRDKQAEIGDIKQSDPYAAPKSDASEHGMYLFATPLLRKTMHGSDKSSIPGRSGSARGYGVGNDNFGSRYGRNTYGMSFEDDQVEVELNKNENKWLTFAQQEKIKKEKILAASTRGDAQVSAETEELEKEKEELSFVTRKVKATLNKLTPDNVDKLAAQTVGLIGKPTYQKLTVCIDLIFDKAVDEPNYNQLYTQYFDYLRKNVRITGESIQQPAADDTTVNNSGSADPANVSTEKTTATSNTTEDKLIFQRMLVNKCQKAFMNKVAFAKGDTSGESEASEQITPAAIVDPKEELLEHIKYKRRLIGNIKFIGELFKRKLVTERIIHTCIQHLLDVDYTCYKDRSAPSVASTDRDEDTSAAGSSDGILEQAGASDDDRRKLDNEEQLECLVKLFKTVGGIIDRPSNDEGRAQQIDLYFDIISKLAKKQTEVVLSARLRFMLEDLLTLRKAKWISKSNEDTVPTISEVRRQALQTQMQLNNSGSGSSSYNRDSGYLDYERGGPLYKSFSSSSSVMGSAGNQKELRLLNRSSSNMGLAGMPGSSMHERARNSQYGNSKSSAVGGEEWQVVTTGKSGPIGQSGATYKNDKLNKGDLEKLQNRSKLHKQGQKVNLDANDTVYLGPQGQKFNKK